MTPQEIQLLSDTVKIGFPVIGTITGAAIGGISTYFLTKTNHRHESRKELTKRRFDLLMQTANDVIEFEHVMGIYATAISNKVQGFKLAVDLSEAQTNAHNKSQSLRRARMALKILALAEAEEELEKYIQLTREMGKYNVALPKERASELSKVISKGPTEFYSALAKEIEIHRSTR